MIWVLVGLLFLLLSCLLMEHLIGRYMHRHPLRPTTEYSPHDDESNGSFDAP